MFGLTPHIRTGILCRWWNNYTYCKNSEALKWPTLILACELVKRNSRALIELAVRKYAPISRIQLAKVTGLSNGSVGTMVDELLYEGIIEETGGVTGSRGRPRVLLDINANGAPDSRRESLRR